MIEKLYRFTCDDCKKTVKEYSGRQKAKNIGWAIARDNKTCYCPMCAIKHRSAGCKSVSGQQIKID